MLGDMTEATNLGLLSKKRRQAEEEGIDTTVPDFTTPEENIGILEGRLNEQEAQRKADEAEQQRLEQVKEARRIMADPTISDAEKRRLIQQRDLVGAQASAEPPSAPEQFAPDPRQQPASQPSAPTRNPASRGIGRLGRQRREFEAGQEKAQEMLDTSLSSEAEALKEKAEARRQYFQEEAQLMDEARQKALELRERQQEQENYRVGQLKKAENELNDMVADFRSKKVDPNRLASKKTRVQVGNMLGSAFGALAAAKLGVAGNTYAASAARNMQSIEAEIERDIRAQQDDISKLRTAIGMKENGFQMMRQRFGDERVAEEALRVALWDQVEQEAKSKLSKMNASVAGAEGKELMAQVGAKKAEAISRMGSVVNENALRTINAQEQLRMKGAAVQAQQAQAEAQAQGRVMPVMDTEQIGPASKKDREKAVEIMRGYNAVSQSINDLQKFRGKEGYAFKGEEATAIGRVKAARAIKQLALMDQAGANFTEMEKALITAGVPEDPTELGRVAARLEEMGKRVAEEAGARLRAHGFRLTPKTREKVGAAQ